MSISLNSNSQATQHALSFSSKMKLNQDSTLRMSSGKRIVNSYDDAGQLSVSAKTNSHYKAETHLVQSLSNSLSFLDTQKGLLENVASILSKFSSLRTNYENPSFTEGVNENYDKIFKELQRELKAISRQKFNHISIFSDQMPKTLFGDAIGLDRIQQSSDAMNIDDTISLTRWGIYRDLSVSLESGDPLPDEFGTDPPRDLLVFALSDESTGSLSYDYESNPGKGRELFLNDVNNWVEFTGSEETNLDAKIALMRVEEGDYGKQLLPDGVELPGFAELFEEPVFPRDGGTIDDLIKVNEGFDSLKNAFLSMTNDGSQLPRGLAVFVDNTGSMKYEDVDGAAQNFMEWIRINYSEVATHPVTKNSGQWNNGIYFNSDEQWIGQSLNAIKDLLSDPDFPVDDGSLNNDTSGVKGLLDVSYSLKDFDQGELLAFQEKISSALAQNGAEFQAVKFAVDNLQNLRSIRFNAFSNSDATDYSTESTRLIKNQFLIEGGATLLNKFKNLTATALTVLEA